LILGITNFAGETDMEFTEEGSCKARELLRWYEWVCHLWIYMDSRRRDIKGAASSRMHRATII